MMPQRQPERIVSGQAFDEDARIDVSVRPKRLDEYIGQKRVKENIQIAIARRAAVAKRSTTCCSTDRGPRKDNPGADHCQRVERADQDQRGPLLERKGDLTAILTRSRKRRFSFWMKFTACSLRWRNPVSAMKIFAWT